MQFFFPRKPKPVPNPLKDVGSHFFQGKQLPEEADSWEWDFFPPLCVWRGCWRSSRISDGQRHRSLFSRGGEGNPKPVVQREGREILNHLCRGRRGNPRSLVKMKKKV